ncbi:MAG TPA: OmpA family protein [Rhodanobacter sp.]|nr:OmpA family protein [Rhodanobacter sp.]
MGSLPGYVARNPPRLRAYDSVTFVDDKQVAVDVAGQSCEQDYLPKDGTQPMSALERQMNYRSQLEQLGASIVQRNNDTLDAHMTGNGRESWFEVQTDGDYIHVTVLNKHPFKSTFIDTPSKGDYAPLGHMPDYEVNGTPKKENFDQDSFTVKDGDSSKSVTVQGARYRVNYSLRDGATPYSNLDLLTNYRRALLRLGGDILYADDNKLDARIDKNGQPVWLEADLDSTNIYISVIEEKPFVATIKPPQAGAMKAALDKDGRIALNIDFDFDKATLRPDATPIITQLVALLKDDPELKLSIEGNTDNIGGHDYNVKLSQERAAAVVAELIKAGIAANRLGSTGNGPDKPVADNATTEGRAKNRRVELVKA